MTSQPTMGQLRKLTQIIEGTPPWRMQQILGSGILHDVFDPNASLRHRDRIREDLELTGPAYGDFTIRLDYGKPFVERLNGANLNSAPFKSSDSPLPFRIDGQGVHELWVRPFEFGTPTTSAAACNLMTWNRADWMPGRLEDLLELATNHVQDLEPGRHYVALGSISIGSGLVPVLRVVSDGSAWIDTESFSRGRNAWPSESIFIAVRHLKPPE